MQIEPATSRLRVVAAVIERDGKVLVCQRPAHKRHGDLWEFPGGKVEAGEDDRSALRRELREELLVDVLDAAPEQFRNDDPGSAFTIAFIPITIAGEPQALEHQAVVWAAWDTVSDLPLAPSDRRFVEYVLEREKLRPTSAPR